MIEPPFFATVIRTEKIHGQRFALHPGEENPRQLGMFTESSMGDVLLSIRGRKISRQFSMSTESSMESATCPPPEDEKGRLPTRFSQKIRKIKSSVPFPFSSVERPLPPHRHGQPSCSRRIVWRSPADRSGLSRREQKPPVDSGAAKKRLTEKTISLQEKRNISCGRERAGVDLWR
ncbi:hypothetical protein ACPVTF_04360 [Geobacillus icigianus]|uniref:hypothetical protein n=1 Tax=Geobacillus TaxID=129337 RepID=UPI00129015CE|nr:hypothetical protein [Geobacillus sp. B4113_201601]